MILQHPQIQLPIAKPTLNQMNNNKVRMINNKVSQKNSARVGKKKVALTQI